MMTGCGDDSSGGSSAGGGDGEETGSETSCGNGVKDSGEACDDGNTQSGDGCSANCAQIEEGYTCPQAGKSCTKSNENVPKPGSKCGNGKLDEGEACDDGNTTDNDGCAGDCSAIDPQYACPDEGALCIPADCGNNIVDANEECDAGDFNLDGLYGAFEGLCGKNCKPAHFCGDGLLDDIDRENGEECDGGSNPATDTRDGCTYECKRVNYCGDGIIQKDEGEECDDGNENDNDGCSSACLPEAGFSCITEMGKSVCTAIACGNGTLDSDIGEKCDDGNRLSGDGCASNCQTEKGYLCTTSDGKSVCTRTCGNGTLEIEAGEACDDGNSTSGDGCSESCVVEPGWVCPDAGNHCIAKACGDGIQVSSEECDDGNTADGDGCSYRCKIEKGWLCTSDGCEEGRCGDGIVQKGEECDNDIVASGAPAGGDGCSAKCRIETDFECTAAGGPCLPVACGDGSISHSDGFISSEQCDLGTDASGNSLNDGTKGCASDCTIVKGFHCNETGRSCTPGICGDGVVDAGEDCDDMNHLPADGCSPDCRFETGIECENGVCKPICGDGVTMWMLDAAIAEQCDDGNLVNGDGCSSECKIEKGYTCTEFSYDNPPDFISLPVTYRDFRSTGRDTTSNSISGDGFITAEHVAKYPETHWTSSRVGTTITDFDSQSGCPSTGYTLPDLDEDGKPVLAKDGFGSCFSTRAEYGFWYRNIPGINKEVKHRIYMWLEDVSTKRYYFTSDHPRTNGAPNTCADGDALIEGYFLPVGSKGFGYTNNSRGDWSGNRNYSFTSEVSTYFQYKGGETLKFSGDDDLWVYLNGHLFVDLGGLHGPQIGTGTLGAQTFKDSEGNPVLKADGSPLLYDPTFNVYEGGIYEIKLFHAERNATGSNFSLTLTNFLNSGTADCSTICGDGIIRGAEECDYVGIDTDVALQKEKGCSADCKLKASCGNNKIERGEMCDVEADWCVDCMLSPNTCGDGILDDHEECDGEAGIKEGQKCLDTCRISGCGDGILDAESGEECDDGNTSDDDMCSSKCTIPRCGDGVVQKWLGEVCDDINDGAYGHCGLGCTYLPPHCGDGIVDKTEGEACDDGTNSGAYGTCNEDCSLPEYCGDGIIQYTFEACDDGIDNGKGNCSTDCTKSVN